jgi:hypothetical protein
MNRTLTAIAVAIARSRAEAAYKLFRKLHDGPNFLFKGSETLQPAVFVQLLEAMGRCAPASSSTCTSFGKSSSTSSSSTSSSGDYAPDIIMNIEVCTQIPQHHQAAPAQGLHWCAQCACGGSSERIAFHEHLPLSAADALQRLAHGKSYAQINTATLLRIIASQGDTRARFAPLGTVECAAATAAAVVRAAAAAAAGGGGDRGSACDLAVRKRACVLASLLTCICCVPGGDAQVIAAAAAVVNTPGAVEALLQAGLAAAALENLDDRVSPLKCLSAVATGIKRADGQQGEAESAAVAAWVRVMTESAGLAADVLCDCLAEAGPRAELGMQLALHLTCILRTFEPVAMAVTAAVALRAARFFPLLAAAARRPGAALGLQEDLWEALLWRMQRCDQAMAAVCCPETVGALLAVLASARAAPAPSEPTEPCPLAAGHKASVLDLQGAAAQWLSQVVVCEHKSAPARRSAVAAASGAAAILVGCARAGLDAAAAAAAAIEGCAPRQGSELAAHALWTMAVVGIREVGIEGTARPTCSDGCSCGGNSSSSSRETSSSGKHVHNDGTSGNWAWFEALQRFSAVPLAVRALEMPQLTLSQKTDAAFLLAALVYGQQRRQQEQEQEQERGAGGASGNAASTDACLADGGDAAALRSRAWAVLAEAMLKGWGLTEVQWLCGFSHTFRNELAAAPGALAAVAAILLNPQTSQSDAALALQLIDELEVWAAWRWQLDGRDNRDRSRVSSGGGGSSGSGSKGGGFSGRGECAGRGVAGGFAGQQSERMDARGVVGGGQEEEWSKEASVHQAKEALERFLSRAVLSAAAGDATATMAAAEARAALQVLSSEQVQQTPQQVDRQQWWRQKVQQLRAQRRQLLPLPARLIEEEQQQARQDERQSPADAVPSGPPSGNATKESPRTHQRGIRQHASTCAACGKQEAVGGVRLHLCRGCRAAWFCSDACYKGFWPNHKAACRQEQARRAAQPA